MDQKTSIFLFQNNLRLADNRALHQALKNSDKLILLFIIDERLYQETPVSAVRASHKRLKFLGQALSQLEDKIVEKGGSLLIKRGRLVDTILATVKEENCKAVYATAMPGTEEASDLYKIEDGLVNEGIALHLTQETTLFHPEDIPWPIAKLPSVFTQFRKENEKQTAIRQLVTEPENLKKAFISEGINNQELINSLLKVELPNALLFQGGEEEANKRLHYYLWETNLVKQYKETRNGLLGKDFSSKLSPYLALGCISPRTIYFELKAYEKERGANQSTYWLYFELMWRDYFHFILKKHGSQLFSDQGIKEEAYEWSTDKEAFQRWMNGTTGIPFIDANMRELAATGYMSNRGRQLVASFLTHDLNIDWRWGAWYFEQQLLDYDVASNWGNWAYVAGVGNDPRKNRYFNILSQAKRYDAQGDYVRHWLPHLKEIEGFNVHKIPLIEAEMVSNALDEQHKYYLSPMVDMKKWDH